MPAGNPTCLPTPCSPHLRPNFRHFHLLISGSRASIRKVWQRPTALEGSSWRPVNHLPFLCQTIPSRRTQAVPFLLPDRQHAQSTPACSRNDLRPAEPRCGNHCQGPAEAQHFCFVIRHPFLLLGAIGLPHAMPPRRGRLYVSCASVLRIRSATDVPPYRVRPGKRMDVKSLAN